MNTRIYTVDNKNCGSLWLTVTLPDYSLFNVLHEMPARTSYEKGVCLSVGLSVSLSNAWFVTKQKEVVHTFLYHMKDYLP